MGNEASAGFLRSVSADQRTLDFCNQEGEVGLVEARPWRRDAVVLDVGRNMLVVRVGAGKRWIIGVFLGIIPVEFLLASRPGNRTQIRSGPWASTVRYPLSYGCAGLSQSTQISGTPGADFLQDYHLCS